MKKTNPSSSSKINNFEREQYLYLTTRGRKSGLPREIEIWFTYLDGRFYVIAEYPTANWLQNLQAHSEGQVRISSQNFSVQAGILDPQSNLHRTVADLSIKKYGWGDGSIVELVRTEN